jgi:hypothetical protein
MDRVRILVAVTRIGEMDPEAAEIRAVSRCPTETVNKQLAHPAVSDFFRTPGLRAYEAQLHCGARFTVV